MWGSPSSARCRASVCTSVRTTTAKGWEVHGWRGGGRRKRSCHPSLPREFPLRPTRGEKTLTVALSAAIGNTVASFSRVPYEVVKQKLQTGQHKSTSSAVTTMVKEGGLGAFFPRGGVGVQMARDIPYAVVTLLCYEYFQENWVAPRKRMLAGLGETGTPEEKKGREGGSTGVGRAASSSSLDMIAGALAGGIGSFVTNPQLCV